MCVSNYTHIPYYMEPWSNPSQYRWANWGSEFTIFHGGLTHLCSNLFPMYILGSIVGTKKTKWEFVKLTLLLIILSGLLLWIFGRNAEHIGASGLVFAYFGYLLSSWWYGTKEIISTIIVGIVLLLYWTLIPSIFINAVLSAQISWDGHLTGLIAGIMIGKFTTRKE